MLGERVGSITIVERGVQSPVKNLNSQNKNRVLTHLFSKFIVDDSRVPVLIRIVGQYFIRCIETLGLGLKKTYQEIITGIVFFFKYSKFFFFITAA